MEVNENQFKEGGKIKDIYSQSENDIARSNSLFITAVKSFGGGLAKEIVDYLSGYIIVLGLFDLGLHKNAEKSLEDEAKKAKIAI